MTNEQLRKRLCYTTIQFKGLKTKDIASNDQFNELVDKYEPILKGKLASIVEKTNSKLKSFHLKDIHWDFEFSSYKTARSNGFITINDEIFTVGISTENEDFIFKDEEFVTAIDILNYFLDSQEFIDAKKDFEALSLDITDGKYELIAMDFSEPY